jgi:ribulose-bisphosphate carboxylase small chain
MRLTQGAFSFLPELSDTEIHAQVDYALSRGWACAVEFTDDPHPRNTYWEMWGLPMFDLKDAAGIMAELRACREAHPQHYIKINAFDSSCGVESVQLSFIVQRPSEEPGFALERGQGRNRVLHYGLRSYAADRPQGRRYSGNDGSTL